MTLATRRTDLDGLGAFPEVDVAATEAAAARVAEAIASHQRLRGALDALPARDDEKRGWAADLTGEIEPPAKASPIGKPSTPPSVRRPAIGSGASPEA